MTVLSPHPDTQLVGAGPVVLPRVNLLPPEIRERARFRRVQMQLGAAVVASMAVVGVLAVSASHSVSSAQGEVDAATAQQLQVTRQITQYGGVTQVYAAAEQARAQLASAMADEVRYSQLLNDLSLSIPSNVWLTNLSYTQTAPDAGKGATPVPVELAPIGSATYQAVAFSHDDVATMLEALSGLKTYSNAYFSNSTEALLGTRKTVQFSGTVQVTPGALSHRYDKAGG